MVGYYKVKAKKGLLVREGAALDRHHSFIVKYEPGKDLGLDMHTDNSDVTFNVCLGKKFTGAPLNFCGVLGQSNHRRFTFKYKHVMGRFAYPFSYYYITFYFSL